jgi:hypothetical protein
LLTPTFARALPAPVQRSDQLTLFLGPESTRSQTSSDLADADRDTGHDRGTACEMPALPPNTILVVEVGSTAHGTGLPGQEDHDEIGVVVESPAEVLGFNDAGMRSVMQRSEPEGSRPGDTDRTLHSVRRFVRLAVSGNPSILMCFWAPVISVTPGGIELRALGESFVGRHVIPRDRGYMQAQAERLVGARGSGRGTRGGGREELVGEHGYDTKYAMHCARLGFQGIELLSTGRLKLPIGGEAADWLRAVRRGEVPFEEWWERALDLDSKLEAMADDDTLPSGPDRERIETWLVGVHLRSWSSRA